MRPLWFFHLYILSSATTAWSTLCQGRLYPHIYIYIYITILSAFFKWFSDKYYNFLPLIPLHPLYCQKDKLFIIVIRIIIVYISFTVFVESSDLVGFWRVVSNFTSTTPKYKGGGNSWRGKNKKYPSIYLYLWQMNHRGYCLCGWCSPKVCQFDSK